MVSHWILSDSKSPQVSRTILSILADLNNAVVWMVSTRPLISKSSNSYTSLLVTVPRAPITLGITVTFMFHNFFNSLARSRYLFFFSLSFYSVVSWDSKVHNSAGSLLFIYFLKIITRSGRLAEIGGISLHLKIPEEFVCLVLHDRCWVVHIPFVRMVKFKLLAQFPVDHLAQPVVYSLILFLY